MIVYICKMNLIELEKIESLYNSFYQNKLRGRWIQLPDIVPIMDRLSPIFKRDKIGSSFLKKDIYSIEVGKGKTKILIWSQMHGNESTGTKAVFDFFNFLENRKFKPIKESILKNCTLVFIPMLNPDGSELYTRENSQNIDLNRDVIDKKAGESILLQEVLESFNPEFCFNLHDQRTIFSIGTKNKPATLSFLAPSEDEERTITPGRKKSMKVIVSMYNSLKKFIPGQIGRYTDEFYPTATGDNFQKMGHNTILIESGHFKNDYQREISRKYTFLALLQGVCTISNNVDTQEHNEYFKIPDNQQNYLDILVKNIQYKNEKVDLGLLFKEKLENSKLQFIPEIEKTANLDAYDANTKIDGSNLRFDTKKDINEWIKNEFI